MRTRLPMKRKRRMVRPKRNPGYRSGMLNRTSQNSNFRIGSRAIRPSTSSSTVSTLFTASTSGSAVTGGKLINVQQTAAGDSLFTIGGTGFGSALRIVTDLNRTVLFIGNGNYILGFTGSDTMQSMYDFYRIDRVEISMYIGASTTMLTSGTSISVTQHATPVIVFAVDSNDSDDVTQTRLLSYANVQMKQADINSPILMSYKPAAAAEFGNVLANVGTGPVFSPKVACTTPQVPHYGVKLSPMGMSVVPADGTNLATVNFVIKQYVTFFDRRTAA